MDKRLNQIYLELMKLPNQPKSMKQAVQLINSYLQNCNFETMKEEDHHNYINLFSTMLMKFRHIRGR